MKIANGAVSKQWIQTEVALLKKYFKKGFK